MLVAELVLFPYADCVATGVMADVAGPADDIAVTGAVKELDIGVIPGVAGSGDDIVAIGVPIDIPLATGLGVAVPKPAAGVLYGIALPMLGRCGVILIPIPGAVAVPVREIERGGDRAVVMPLELSMV